MSQPRNISLDSQEQRCHRLTAFIWSTAIRKHKLTPRQFFQALPVSTQKLIQEFVNVIGDGEVQLTLKVDGEK